MYEIISNLSNSMFYIINYIRVLYVKFFIIKVYNVEYEFNYYYVCFIFLVDVFFYIVIESFYFYVK